MFFEDKVTISDSASAIVYASAERSYPRECCGFLWGQGTAVTFAAEVDNVAQNEAEQFEISPAAYMAAERYAESNNLTLMGIFHSHPDSDAVPSGRDLEMAMPNFLYMIVAVSWNAVKEGRCWRLNDAGEFREIIFRSSIINSLQK